MIEQAASGDLGARDGFATAYLPVVRAYLSARWPTPGQRGRVEDALQDVFLDCLKDGGAIERVQRDAGARFRTWLYKVTLNVARRHEERGRTTRGREGEGTEFDEDPEAREPALSLVFDRAWAQRMIRKAAEAMRAAADSDLKKQRLTILELRFGEGLPIREIAERLQVPPSKVHHDYAYARDAFKRALREVVADHCVGSVADVERECLALLARL